MPITRILELRILPPFAIGRLGSSSEPMDNYQVVINEEDPIGYRKLLPAETLVVDRSSGKITGLVQPSRVQFRDAEGRIRPVAPFLEVWARFEKDGPLLPLTKHHLSDLDLKPADLQWSVHVGNIKVFRRTGDPHDKAEAMIGPFSDHKVMELHGVCDNFLPGKFIFLGSVQYIKPTDAFPEIRLRFTPAPGKVYGPPGKDGASDDVVPVYDPTRGHWVGYEDPLNSRRNTNPGNVYAGRPDPKDPQNLWISRGFLDDECDGIIDVQLTYRDKKAKAQKTLGSYARISVGPPTFAPDSFPVRTVADELEQAMFGPDVDTPAPEGEVEEILRRVIDTVRLMNTEVMNRPTQGMGRMDHLDVGRAAEPIQDLAIIDSLAIRSRHERVLLALESGSLAWFARVLREYDEVGDLSDEGRRKMPSLMRGADARHLALTRRQVNKVRAAARALLAADSNTAHKKG